MSLSKRPSITSDLNVPPGDSKKEKDSLDDFSNLCGKLTSTLKRALTEIDNSHAEFDRVASSLEKKVDSLKN
ncbi:hypothetical protein DAMA08_032210 [Martiniozyma asiatica (nom. inval.)]|nr:hypothetical protein DAMA08_032210 [Martiniozyma asiatica]